MDVLENSTKETATTSAYNILARSLNQVYNESIAPAGINLTMDNKLGGIDDDHEITNQEEDAHGPLSREKVTREKHM